MREILGTMEPTARDPVLSRDDHKNNWSLIMHKGKTLMDNKKDLHVYFNFLHSQFLWDMKTFILLVKK